MTTNLNYIDGINGLCNELSDFACHQLNQIGHALSSVCVDLEEIAGSLNEDELTDFSHDKGDTLVAAIVHYCAVIEDFAEADLAEFSSKIENAYETLAESTNTLQENTQFVIEDNRY